MKPFIPILGYVSYQNSNIVININKSDLLKVKTKDQECNTIYFYHLNRNPAEICLWIEKRIFIYFLIIKNNITE
jgi:hypothetical protein